MKNKILSYLVIILTIFFINACSTLQTERTLVQKRIDSLLVSDFFKSSQAAISVYDLNGRKSVYQLNDKILFRPASNQKILTTAASLKFLGADYKFTTSIFHSGEVRDSICCGDIYIVGGFDPEFSSGDLDSLTKEIKKFGIKEIKGNLYGDVSAMDSLYLGNGWMWDDDPNAYMPYLSSLTINKNCVTVIYQPTEVGSPANISLSPATYFIPIENNSITTEDEKSSFSITRDWLNKKNTITVTGKLNVNSKLDSVKLNLVNPASYFLMLAKESVIRNNIIFTGIVDTMSVKSSLHKIFSYERNINVAIKNANKMSDNLNGELLLRELAHKHFGNRASAEKGKIFLDSLITLAGCNSKHYRLVDGSGLSFYNLITTELLINVLKYISEQDATIKDNFTRSLAIAGVDGTLANRFVNNPAKEHVFAKTGGLSGVSNLSGYIETVRGTQLAFSILVQNFIGSSAEARKFQEKICEILYQEL